MQFEKIETGYSNHPQLYKTDEDEHEDHNVATQYPAIVYDFQKLMRELKAETP